MTGCRTLPCARMTVRFCDIRSAGNLGQGILVQQGIMYCCLVGVTSETRIVSQVFYVSEMTWVRPSVVHGRFRNG